MKIFKKTLAVVLCFLMAFSTVAVCASAIDFADSEHLWLVSKTSNKIAPGITETNLTTRSKENNEQNMGYAVEIDLSSGNTLMAGYNDYSKNSVWRMATVRNQAAACSAKTGANIVAAVNADIFNMSTGEPRGALIMDGTVVKAGVGDPYFAILKDGTPVIGEKMTAELAANCQEAVSGFYVLALNGKRVNSGWDNSSNYAPKTLVGIKPDGKVVLYTCDGRNYPISCGMADRDACSVMLSLGCVDVLNLDGGGSTTFAAKYEGESNLTIKNKPSDGMERTVSSSLFVVSNAKPTGVFDHASLAPNNEVYTPYSAVDFSALGVDSAGTAVALPTDGSFALADDSFGTITADGKFVSTGKTGTVEVNYVSNGAVCGSTTIEVQNPTDVTFASEEVNLGFEAESTLGLTVKYNGRDVNYKDGDFKWNLIPDVAKDAAIFKFNGKDVKAENGTYYFAHYEAGSKKYVSDRALTADELVAFESTMLGSFAGNVFTSSADNSHTGVAVATYAYDESVYGQIKLVIGKNPTVVMDFENYTDDDDNVIDAKDYWTFAGGVCEAGGGQILSQVGTGKMLAATYGRNAVPSPEIIDISSGYPVRFGNHSLKLGYDFTKVGDVTEGVCVGFVDQTSQIEGIPTGIGMWVYAPEGTPNLWLRIRVKDGSGTVQTVNFTGSGVNDGITWSGWKYLEADLTGLTGPFSLIGGETIRIMFCYATKNGLYKKNFETGEMETLPRADCKGEIYIDNLQFVYGANTDDIDNPEIKSVMANATEIENGMTVDSNTVSFRAVYGDVQNKYTTGVDPDTVAIFVDGKEMTKNSNCTIMKGDETIYLDNVELANGPHNVSIRVRDGFGNETIEGRTFVVDGDKQYGTVYAEKVDDSAVLGQEFAVALKSNSIDDINAVSTDFVIDPVYKDSYTVDFANGFTGTSSYDANSNSVKISASRGARAVADDDTIAVLSFKIPQDLAEGKYFTYSLANGSIDYATEKSEFFANSFSSTTQRVAVSAGLNVEIDPMIVGVPMGNITITNLDGEKVAGAEVYANGKLIGTTDENGVLKTGALSKKVAAYKVYAKTESDYSFVKEGQSVNAGLNAEGKPEYVVLNAIDNSETKKNITWLSNPVATEDNAVVLLAKKADYEANGDEAFKEVEAESSFFQFLGSSDVNANYAVRINTAVLTGLLRDNEYAYKVGDGKIFSEVKYFKTMRNNMATNFFILGDTQVEDKANANQIFNNLKESGLDFNFAIQTGDSIESANVYRDWINNLELFGDDYLSNVDVFHVMGNHEYMGDPDGVAATTIYNIPDEACYSAQYGNIYVATMSFTSSVSEIQERLDWIVDDAKKSDAQWKILVMHQPTYWTNATAPSSEMTARVPAAAQEAGIDFVFSGHDHTYARTKPLYNGEVDSENGVVYMICGTTGGKSYSVDPNTKFNFDIATQEFEAVYTTVEANDEEFIITAHNLDGSILDSYTKKSNIDCTTAGHNYTYSEGYLSCSRCNYTTKVGSYTGYATNEATGSKMYFLSGVAQTGWFLDGTDAYYFDENGVAVTGTQDIGAFKGFEFDSEGKQIGALFVVGEDGKTRAYRGSDTTPLHSWQELNGETYYFSRTDGAMRTGKTTIESRTRQKLEYVFTKDGKLIRGAFYNDGVGTVYYWGDEKLSGWQEIEGKKYYFNPVTNYMADDTTEIDGKIYAFNQDGQLVHKGAHSWDKGVLFIKGSCTVDTSYVYTCAECKSIKTVTKPAPGHKDKDKNGRCDVCFKQVKKETKILDSIRIVFSAILFPMRAIIAKVQSLIKLPKISLPKISLPKIKK